MNAILYLFAFGYWLGGRPSAAVLRESARNRADSARFRADPANFHQNNFLADSAERPANSAGLRAKTGGSARSSLQTGGRVHSKNVRRQKLIFHHCSSRKNFGNGRPSAAEIFIGSGLGLGLGSGFRLGLWLRLGLRLGLEYHNPNPNPNPDPSIISAAEGRPQRKFFRGEPWCKGGFCRRTFFE